MSRIGLVSVKCLRLGRQSLLKIASRTFLSEAYQCREAWEKRLESPLLKKVNLVHLYKELEHNYSDTENISAVDADIFINAFTPAGFLEDVEDVIQKLRRSSDSHSTPPSSHYATVRLFLDAGKLPTLFKIISDKINYGIFPDQYCMNIMMDTLLKQEKFALAARVATLQMLQEDWDNSLTTRLAMFSCHMYLKNLDQVWLFEEEIVSPEPEPKEVIKVRVRYIRKPFFDDHFDLKDPQLLVGKTLSMFSSKVGGSEQLNLSYKLVGLTLYKKWDEVFNFVDYINKNKKTIYREALQLARMSLEVIPVSESLSEEEAKASKPAKVDPAKVAKEAALKEEHEWKQKTSQKLCELDACVTDGDLLDEMSSLVKEAVAQQQQKDIEQQKELYVQWEEERYKVLKAQQERLRKEETLRKIEEQKKLLAEEEKEIFFFENEDKLDLMIEKNEEIISKFNEKNVKVKDNKAAKDADYVPPEVFKRYS